MSIPAERRPLLSPQRGSNRDGDAHDESIAKHHNLAGLSAWRFRLICGSIWTCSFLSALDGTIIATLLTPIGSSFNASNQSSWLGTSYLLAVSVSTPIYGRLADSLGRRVTHLIALGFFTAGTILCTFAPSMNSLIAARTIAGLGGGAINTVGVIILTDLVDLRQRGLFQGYANIMFGLGAGLGGPVGGYISDTFGWRVAFGFQVPLLFIAGTGVWINVGHVKQVPPGAGKEKLGWKRKLSRVDWLGSLFLILCVGSLLLALSYKTSSIKSNGDEYAWSDPMIYGLLLTSALTTIGFIAVEGYISPEPILPLALLARRTPAGVALCNFFMVIVQFSMLYNIPLYFSAVRLQPSSVAGAHLLPNSLLICVGSVSAGWWIRKTGRYWWLTIMSLSLIVLSSAALCWWDQNSPGWLTWVAQAPTGLGYAGALTTTLVALVAEVTNRGQGEQAVATSMSYLFRYVAQVLGVACSAAIVQAILKADLNRLITGPGASEIIDMIRHSTSGIKDLDPAVQRAAVEAYDHALHVVFICNLAFSVLALVGFTIVREEGIPEGPGAAVSREEESEN